MKGTVNPDKDWTAYALIDPFVHEVFYIGVTSQSVEARRRKHESDARQGKPGRVYEYIRNVQVYGGKIIIVALPAKKSMTWEEAEKYWIKTFIEMGSELLTNESAGGGGAARPHKPETKEHIRQGVLAHLVAANSHPAVPE